VQTPSQQLLITVGGLALAAVAIVLAAAYQGDQTIDDGTVLGGTATTASTDASGGAAVEPKGADGQSTTSGIVTDPLEAFLPRSGQASACQEAVGVDLAPGYAATLTINGIPIAPEEMNSVAIGADGKPSGAISASRSLGEYTFGPEPKCPNGRVLRPTNNVLQACIYRLVDGPANCVIEQNSFDVL
jgi:hypothetical protein